MAADGRDMSSGLITLRQRLQAAVQSIHWTYAVFWRPSQRGELAWADGYYNGSVKTRKTIIVRERSPEEYGLQRSDQLRELFESLSSSSETSQVSSTRRPTAALSPEDLTDTEWFYLVCMSCTFDAGTGIPGQAFTKGRPIWLCKANEASTKVFSRALLAKTACIQTVVCIPLAEGVLELGSTDLVREDTSIVQRIVSFFVELSKPTVSEQSISSSQSGENGHEESQPEQHAIRELEKRRSAFFQWRSSELQAQQASRQSQRLLKKVLLRVPHMYAKLKLPECDAPAESSQRNMEADGQGKSAPRKDEELNNTAHAMLERRRREKLNERFIILRKLVPFVTKMDKASILGDTIEYLKQLQKRVAELERSHRRFEAKLRGVQEADVVSENEAKSPEREQQIAATDMEAELATCTASPEAASSDSFEIQVSQDEATLDIQCCSRKGLLFDIVAALNELNLSVSALQAGTEDKVLRASIKAEVKDTSSMLRPSEEDIDDALRRAAAFGKLSP